ncbi:hypothetical protein D3C78_1761600 [compost metagenome]
MTLLAYRDSKRGGLAILTYDRLSALTGVSRHRVADAITLLYQMNLISFRQAAFSETDDRTNRYLIRGVGSYWDALDEEVIASKPRAPTAPNRSKQGIDAANKFVRGES